MAEERNEFQRLFDAGNMVPFDEPRDIEIVAVDKPAVGEVHGAIGTYYVLTEVDDEPVAQDEGHLWTARGRRLVARDITTESVLDPPQAADPEQVVG